ncbi:phage protein Gp27 family protein [Acidimangrovimonas sediminis]|uniref:phage protein Gp27 family protein n=1 Tax=Acidimangrovimonas sediminis TaxID=2056283 RepID=UPI000C80C52E|nr:phage protein Gp27 family protein [Acidimangrovimonas sediminis]
MPVPRKVDLLPPELKSWLQAELRQRGFGGYEDLAEALNFRLEEEGLELRIRKSALHEFGSEYREFVRLQEQASDWAQEWLGEMGMDDQAQRQNVLFQMLTTLAFKVMQAQVSKTGDEISPQELHFLARMMKDVMHSSGIVQAMREKERKDQAAKLEAAVAGGDIDAAAADKARRILGFA